MTPRWISWADENSKRMGIMRLIRGYYKVMDIIASWCPIQGLYEKRLVHYWFDHGNCIYEKCLYLYQSVPVSVCVQRTTQLWYKVQHTNMCIVATGIVYRLYRVLNGWQYSIGCGNICPKLFIWRWTFNSRDNTLYNPIITSYKVLVCLCTLL
jgi:hypothetical protein